MTTATNRPYIVCDDGILSGEPIIKGTRTPVRAIVETWRMGVPPEDIPTHLPHLTLAQVFDALSYFADHQEEITAHIERNRVSVNGLLLSESALNKDWNAPEEDAAWGSL